MDDDFTMAVIIGKNKREKHFNEHCRYILTDIFNSKKVQLPSRAIVPLKKPMFN